ncbi:MAG: tRNA pseudouridine(38-40) synthase TruA [Pseudomonadota bacterium]
MARVALGVAYSGSAFAGWQRQVATPNTLQETLESGLSVIANEPVRVHAAGRTDAGVHATGQVVHFDTQAERPLRAWVDGTNTKLPRELRVLWATSVPNDFDARRSATARRYLYLYCDSTVRLPLLDQQVWWGRPLAAEAMHRAAQTLVGEHDFSTFRAAGCQSQTPMRHVHQISVVRHGRLVVLDITANAFLLHMVRNIASGLRSVGLGQAPEASLAALLDARDRTQLGPTAPPAGLSLVDVIYPAALPQPTGALPPALLTLPSLDQL